MIDLCAHVVSEESVGCHALVRVGMSSPRHGDADDPMTPDHNHRSGRPASRFYNAFHKRPWQWVSLRKGTSSSLTCVSIGWPGGVVASTWA